MGFCLLGFINFDLFPTRARFGEQAAARNLNKIVSFHVLNSRVAAAGVDTRLVANPCEGDGEDTSPKRKQDQGDMVYAGNMTSAGRIH